MYTPFTGDWFVSQVPHTVIMISQSKNKPENTEILKCFAQFAALPRAWHRLTQHSRVFRLRSRILLSLVAMLSALFTPALAAQDTFSLNSTGTLLITETSALQNDSLFPPEDDLDWQAETLPIADRLGNEEHVNRILWLRFELDEPDQTETYSLYFYRYNLAIDVFFNGVRIGGDTYRPNRQTVSWNHPRIVDIQSANWLEYNNVVHVRLTGSYFGGTFGPILFGPHDVLQPLYEERLFRQIKVNEWLQASGILVVILSLSLWVMRRHDPIYLLFAALTASWLVLQTHMVIYYNLIEYRYWLPLVHISVDLFILFMFLFLTRFVRLPSPRAEKILYAWTAVAICWHVLAPITLWWVGAYVVHMIGNLFMFFVLVRLGINAVRMRDRLSIIIAVTVLVQIALAFHDWMMIMTGDMEDWESAMYLSQFAFPLLLLVFTIGLLNRFVSALNSVEELNRDLEAKVEASRLTIEASYQKRRELELSKAAEEERVKIYRDLHDDVGSKLLSIAHAGRDHKLGELARNALSSLREAVSRANSPQQKLSDFLEALHEECTLRLEGTGHVVEWAQEWKSESERENSEVSKYRDQILAPEQVYNLNQICREITSNIIRHAKADHVLIETSIQERSWSLAFTDSGTGIEEDAAKGNGLGNIRQRAADIDCQVSWLNLDSGGLRVTLVIPLQSESETEGSPSSAGHPESMSS